MTELAKSTLTVFNKKRVNPSIRFLEPPPPDINFVHDHSFFCKNIIFFIILD